MCIDTRNPNFIYTGTQMGYMFKWAESRYLLPFGLLKTLQAVKIEIDVLYLSSKYFILVSYNFDALLPVEPSSGHCLQLPAATHKLHLTCRREQKKTTMSRHHQCESQRIISLFDEVTSNPISVLHGVVHVCIHTCTQSHVNVSSCRLHSSDNLC